jgi:hypothetical protein
MFSSFKISPAMGKEEDWAIKINPSAGIKFFPFQCFHVCERGTEIYDFQNIGIL